MGLVEDLAQAIARYEGFYDPQNIAARNHNPGNLRSWGNYPVVNGYVQFPDDATGWAALRRQVSLNVGRGLNLYEFFGGKPGVYSGYSPAADRNNPTKYADTVAGWLGISPGVRLSSASSGPAVNPPEPSPDSEWWDVPAAASWSLPEWFPYAAAGLGLASVAVLVIWD